MNDKIELNVNAVRLLHKLLTEMLDSIPDGSKQAEEAMQAPARILPGSVVFRTWAVPVDILVTGGQVQRFSVRADLFDMAEAIEENESLMASAGSEFVVDRARSVTEESIEEDTYLHAARLEKKPTKPSMTLHPAAPWTVKR